MRLFVYLLLASACAGAPLCLGADDEPATRKAAPLVPGCPGTLYRLSGYQIYGVAPHQRTPTSEAEAELRLRELAVDPKRRSELLAKAKADLGLGQIDQDTTRAIVRVRYLELLAAESPQMTAFLEEHELTKVLGSGGLGTVVLMQARAPVGLPKSPTFLPRLFVLKIPFDDVDPLGDLAVQEREITEALEWGKEIPAHTTPAGRSVARPRPRLIGPPSKRLVLDGKPLLRMEFIEGQTLERILEDVASRSTDADYTPQKQRAAADDLLNMAQQLADRLDQMHKKGKGHFDFKPENIFMARDGLGGPRSQLLAPREAILLDFGIARPFHDPKAPSAPHAMGSMLYIGGAALTGRQNQWDDPYALGRMLEAMLISTVSPEDRLKMHFIKNQLAGAAQTMLAPAGVEMEKGRPVHPLLAARPRLRQLLVLLRVLGSEGALQERDEKNPPKTFAKASIGDLLFIARQEKPSAKNAALFQEAMTHYALELKPTSRLALWFGDPELCSEADLAPFRDITIGGVKTDLVRETLRIAGANLLGDTQDNTSLFQPIGAQLVQPRLAAEMKRYDF